MIYDKLSNLKNYIGMNENLDTAINYIMKNDLKSLPLGRTVVDGDKVYINVMEIETKDSSEVKFEVHKKYFDIHIDLIGKEKLEIGDLNAGCTEYDEEGDCCFSDTTTVNTSLLDETSFCLCYTLEPHKPGTAIAGAAKLKKAVVKVLK